MQEFDFQYNFNEINLLEIRDKFGITMQEIISVFENQASHLREIYTEDPDFSIFILIGDSVKERIVMIAFTYPESTVNFIGASPPSQKDIDEYYC